MHVCAGVRIVALPSIAALVHDVRAAVRLFGHDVEHFHRLGKPRELLLRTINDALLALRPRVDAVCAEIATLENIPAPVRVQRDVYSRVLMPGDRAMPFHIDRYTRQHAPSQRALWIPLVDVQGPEGLWIVDDDVMQRALAQGPLRAQQESLREHARPTRMRIGEALLFGAETGHGSVTHHLDVTRASFDVRIVRAEEAPRGRLGWRSRPLE